VKKDILPKVSIVIPCYNHGTYLQETLASIDKTIGSVPYEVIIVNDGSSDPFTNEFLGKLHKDNYKVIVQTNKGVCESRNVAIRAASGEYILPVDADNKLASSYLLKAAAILDEDPAISVVYCDAVLIGDQSGIYRAGTYNLQRLMLDNFIDNCSMYRRTMWEEIGGYESNRLVAGLEDWEFWLRASFAGYKFYYLAEPLFEYRVLANSGIRTLNKNKERNNQILDFFSKKMSQAFGLQYVDEYIVRNLKKHPIGFFAKVLLRAYWPKKFNELVKNNKLRKHL
jgi:glycosyltransferase involved in cell wall biosynthesis